MKKKTQEQIIASTLKRRKNGFTDVELIQATGLQYAHTVRSKMAKAGVVVPVGTKKAASGRVVKTWGLA